MRPDTLAALRRDLAARRPVVVAKWLATGEERLLHPFGPSAGGDPVDEKAREAARRDRSETVETPAGQVFLLVYNPPPRLVVVGAVHVTQALVPMARTAGYDVLVIDPRRSFASADRFQGIPVSTEWPDEALARMGLDRGCAVVTMTHDPKIDDPALAAALRSDAFYVGALGSRKTQAARRERLMGMGLSADDVKRIHGPVGLPIGAVSPGEIAVSILAEIVASLRMPSEPRAA
ncbi:MAG TPA: XdhC family protein [Anaeromyxobacteraceae bacterium]|nr:XdhC family protein [Anaeromyxobacteraceae bacterium]